MKGRALMSVGFPHTSYCTPEGSKVGRHHGDVDGSASHSEQYNTTIGGHLLNHCSEIEEEEWRDT